MESVGESSSLLGGGERSLRVCSCLDVGPAIDATAN